MVAQFPRLKVAHECYQSSDYQSAIKLGKGGFHHSFVNIQCVEKYFIFLIITLCKLVQAVRAARFRSCGSK